MADIGHEETELILRETEREVRQVYLRAQSETQAKLDDYLSRFATKDAIKKQQLKEGKITQAKYRKWRKGQICIGKRWQEMVDTLSQDYVNADKLAMSIVRGYTSEAYAINHNYATFQIERDSWVNTSYTLYDRQTVERLIRDNPDLLPPPGDVDIPKDKRWNKTHIKNEITQGILQGEDLRQISKRLQKVTDMDDRAAMRNARTAMTGAQNAGRVDAYKRAKGMGIKLEQEWLATLDGRTRHSHRQMDGQHVEVGEKFSNKCRFPGDPEGPPWEVYNCRCTLVPRIAGVDQTDAPRDSRLGGMSYEEWKNEHKKQQARAQTVKTMDASYTGRDGTPKFNAYMLEHHPEVVGDMDYAEREIRALYDRRFHLQRSIFENDPEYGIKRVEMSEYLSMRDRGGAFPTFESYREFILRTEMQNVSRPGSIMDTLRRWDLGATAEGYGKGKGARIAFDKEYRLSEFITSHQDVHYTGDTLYRGVRSSKSGIKDLQKAMASGESIDMRGASSWSTSPRIAEVFTESSLRGSKSMTPVVFVEEGVHTRNAMPFPYSSQHGMYVQSEVIYSGDATFQVLKMEEKEGVWYVYVRENARH